MKSGFRAVESAVRFARAEAAAGREVWFRGVKNERVWRQIEGEKVWSSPK